MQPFMQLRMRVEARHSPELSLVFIVSLSSHEVGTLDYIQVGCQDLQVRVRLA